MLKTILILSLWIISLSCASTKEAFSFTPLLEIQQDPKPIQEPTDPLEEEFDEILSATIFIGSHSDDTASTTEQNYTQSAGFEPAHTEVELHERLSDKITGFPVQGDRLDRALVPSVFCVVVLLLMYLIFKKGRV
jgi:hypothetical protein